MKLHVRDFFETNNKIYAVISNKPIVGYLRYEIMKKNNERKLKKVPGKIFIPKNFEKAYIAKERVKEILRQKNLDEFERKIYDLLTLFSRKIPITHIGVTGSSLLKCWTKNSDIDICFYNYNEFEIARNIIMEELNKENSKIKNLNDEQYKALYKKRILNNELKYTEFVWHEKRKFNKASIENTRFDILLCEDTKFDLNLKFYENIKIFGKIIKERGFSFPAYYEISNENNNENYKILCYTHTYTGQAFKGEYVEVSGRLCESQDKRFVIIGTNREAINEYIKVVI